MNDLDNFDFVEVGKVSESQVVEHCLDLTFYTFVFARGNELVDLAYFVAVEQFKLYKRV